MNERVTSTPAPLCGCSRPLVETIRCCTRCGHDLAGEEYALSPRAQRMAGAIADLVLERLEQKARAHPDKKQGARNDLKGQLALDAPACTCPSPLVVDETPRVPTSPPLPGPDRRCVRCGRRAA